MWQRFTLSAREAVLGAQNLSVGSRSSSVGITHLFVATLQKIEADSHLAALLLRAGLKAEEAVLYAQAALEPDAAFDPNAEPKLSAGAKRVLEFAADEARRAGDNTIGTEHLLLGCLRPQRDETLLQAIAPLGWDLHALRAHRRELKSSSAPRPSAHPLESLTGEAERAVDAAYAAMRATFCGRISTAHLLLGLLRNDNRAVELLGETGALTDELRAQTRAVIRSDAVLATPDKRFDKGAKRALDRAKFESQSRGYNFIGADHLLLGLLPKRATLRERLTWGRTVPDEAARVLGRVDGEKLRELAGPKRVAKKQASYDLIALPIFVLGFLSEVICSIVGFSHKNRTQGEAMCAAWAIAFGMGAIIVLFAIALEKPASKLPNDTKMMTALTRSFFAGTLAGFVLGTLLATIRSA